MSVLDRVLAWSGELPPWQSDALRRLFIRRKLVEADYDDLTALAQTSSGIGDEKNRTPELLAATHIPDSAAGENAILLKAMGPVQNVNALVAGQVLTFAAVGITAIYGDNGAGKSGYARVLKRACRARDEEPVRPNAALANYSSAIPEAQFSVSLNGADDTVSWRDDSPSPSALSALSVFDSHCARVYLDDESDIAFKPYGLDLVEELGKACDEVKSRVRRLADGIQVETTAFDDLKGPTAVGGLISSLSAATDPAKVEALATISADETRRIAELDAILKEANPLERARSLRDFSSRLTRSATALDRAFAALADDQWVRYRSIDEALNSAEQVSAEIFKQLGGDAESLPGTGGEAWKNLLLAAQAYSKEAYPGHSFPHVGPDAKCLLCQEPLVEAADRYKRFAAFVSSTAEDQLRQATSDHSVASMEIAAIGVSLSMDHEFVGEVKRVDAGLGTTCEGLEALLSTRRVSFQDSLKTHKYESIVALPTNPAISLRTHAAKATTDADAFERSTDTAVHERLKEERLELTAREALAARKPAVLNTIQRLEHKRRLSVCMAGIDTSSISRKSKTLTQESVSSALGDALNREFVDLGIDHLQVTFTTRADHGTTLQKLRLNLPGTYDISSILSEGEQRALAIASFLAEVSMAPSVAGIVFDDPVSSLDHLRREKVAARLVHEASNRQVIVFTHDLFFLKQLTAEATKQDVPIHYQSVMRQGVDIGVVGSDLPFAGQTTVQRIGVLKQLAQRATASSRHGPTMESDALVKMGYDSLRQGWERVVEEVLLQGVVERFDKGVHTQKLKGVFVEDLDFKEVFDGMTRCSEFTGHDRAPAAGSVVFDAAEFERGVLALEAFQKRVAIRSNTIRQARSAQ